MIVIATIGAGALIVGAVAGYFLAGNNGHTEAGISGSVNNISALGTINNVVVTDVKDKVEIENKEMLIVLCIICGIRIIEFLYFVYREHINNMKKKYASKQVVQAQV